MRFETSNSLRLPETRYGPSLSLNVGVHVCVCVCVCVCMCVYESDGVATKQVHNIYIYQQFNDTTQFSKKNELDSNPSICKKSVYVCVFETINPSELKTDLRYRVSEGTDLSPAVLFLQPDITDFLRTQSC